MTRYEFEPSSHIVAIKEGDHLQKDLTAKRVAYSVYGKVALLNGSPLADSTVEAVEDDGGHERYTHIEEATTDKNGEYRIRGLRAGRQYQLRLKLHGEAIAKRVERTIPETRSLAMSEEDVRSVNFFVFLRARTMQLMGVVHFEGEDAKSFKWDNGLGGKVELYARDNLDELVAEQPIALSRYFQFDGLPKKDYVVRLVPKLTNVIAAQDFGYRTEEVALPFEETPNSVRFLNLTVPLAKARAVQGAQR